MTKDKHDVLYIVCAKYETGKISSNPYRPGRDAKSVD
jgi:hypothetical protein